MYLIAGRKLWVADKIFGNTPRTKSLNPGAFLSTNPKNRINFLICFVTLSSPAQWVCFQPNWRGLLLVQKHKMTLNPSRGRASAGDRSTYAAIQATVGSGASVACAGSTARGSIDRVVVTARTTNRHGASPEYLNVMLLAHMLTCAAVDKVSIASWANNPPLSV